MYDRARTFILYTNSAILVILNINMRSFDIPCRTTTWLPEAAQQNRLEPWTVSAIFPINPIRCSRGESLSTLYMYPAAPASAAPWAPNSPRSNHIRQDAGIRKSLSVHRSNPLYKIPQYLNGAVAFTEIAAAPLGPGPPGHCTCRLSQYCVRDRLPHPRPPRQVIFIKIIGTSLT